MTILVTGGAGFIGNHLCRSLLEQGENVLVVDNLYSGYLENITDLFDKYPDTFTFINFDVSSDLFSLKIQSLNRDINQIYHLACPASPKFYQKEPLKTIKTCINGTINILEFAKKCGAAVLLTSTSEIYGEPLEHPQKESYRGNVNTIGIRSCYDEGKRLAETIMMEYHRLYKVNIKIVRIFNTFGPRMDKNDGRIVSNFINQCVQNNVVSIYGDGKQTRSLCYIDDMVRGLILMMNSNSTGPVNLGNPDERSVNDIANLIIKLTKSNSTTKNCYLPSDDPSRRCPDISKAIELLSWRPEISIEDGLLRTINFVTYNF